MIWDSTAVCEFVLCSSLLRLARGRIPLVQQILKDLSNWPGDCEESPISIQAFSTSVMRLMPTRNSRQPRSCAARPVILAFFHR